MKLLLYCTKAKPYLVERLPFNEKKFYQCRKKNDYYSLNGKIVAECDFTVFDIHPCASYKGGLEYGSNCMWATFINEEDLLNKSCLTMEKLNKYLASNKSSGYGIGIKNLHIFDKPKELSEYCYAIYSHTSKVVNGFRCNDYSSITDMYECGKAPQNMARVFTWDWNEGKSDDAYILISIKPQHLVNILNGNKTIEVRKKVLKEMLQ